jgi:hypothetical protein
LKVLKIRQWDGLTRECVGGSMYLFMYVCMYVRCVRKDTHPFTWQILMRNSSVVERDSVTSNYLPLELHSISELTTVPADIRIHTYIQTDIHTYIHTDTYAYISVYFNIRNTLPKSGTFLLGHSVYAPRPLCTLCKTSQCSFKSIYIRKH